LAVVINIAARNSFLIPAHKVGLQASPRTNVNMSLRGAQRRSNLNPAMGVGRLLRYARNDMMLAASSARRRL
jgi:hypothetical protein